MSEAMINEPPRYPVIPGADLLEAVAKALWEIPPYGRFTKWDATNEGTQYHYRMRAASLLEKFEIEFRHRRVNPPIRNFDDPDGMVKAGEDMEIFGHCLVRLTKPGPEWPEPFGV